MDEGLQKSKVERVVLADGDAHEVACSLRIDGVTSPVTELLELLQGGMWPDPDADELPDEYQPNIRHRFLSAVKYLAKHGELERGYNRLEDGIWEFKIESLRVTFYDTPGDGTFTPKDGGPYSHWKKCPEFPEDFDDFIRVGHFFGKRGQTAPPEDVEIAIQVREEDLGHDRNSTQYDLGRT